MKENKPTLEVCLTPELIHYFDLEGKIVVVIDIFRATSCMTTALANGVEGIIPVAEVQECKDLQNQGLPAAAERNGEKVEGFDLDNSPFSYQNPELKGKKIAVTTTNGTRALSLSQAAKEVLIGSFLNISVTCNYLKKQNQSIILFCAGWRGRVNTEDTFYAGAVIDALQNQFQIGNDASILASEFYKNGKDNYYEYLKESNHFQRLIRLGRQEDVEFVLQKDVYDVVCAWRGEDLKVIT